MTVGAVCNRACMDCARGPVPRVFVCLKQDGQDEQDLQDAASVEQVRQFLPFSGAGAPELQFLVCPTTARDRPSPYSVVRLLALALLCSL